MALAERRWVARAKRVPAVLNRDRFAHEASVLVTSLFHGLVQQMG